MTATSQSPDKLVLRNKPFIGSRLGSRAGLIILGILLVSVITIVASIESRRQHEEEVTMQSQGPATTSLVGSTDAAKTLNDQVGNGVGAVEQAVKTTQAQDHAQAATQQAPVQPVAGNSTGQAAVPDLGGEGGQAVPSIQAAEAQQKLAQAQQQREDDARKAGMTGGGGGNGGSWQDVADSGSSAPTSTAGMSKDLDARQAQLEKQLQSLASQTPSAASMAKAVAGGDGQSSEDDQQKKNTWLGQNSTLTTPILQATRKPAPSPYYLAQGSVIPAITLERIVTDLPGEVCGMVTSPVYDTATGTNLLIPVGAKVCGKYDSSVAFGQDRDQMCFQRIIYPDASTLELGCMTGNDQSGATGFEDQVNNHLGRLIGYGVLTSVMSAAFQLSQPQPTTSANGTTQQLSSQQIVAGSVGQELSQLGMEVTRRNLNVQPTITIRTGYRFVIKVNQDIIFPGPYEP